MDLLVALTVTVALALATVLLSGWTGVELWLPMIVLTALWAARDARRLDMRRYERVFPLDPLALGLAVLLAWPVSFPWYLRLRRRARRGALEVRTRPSRLRYVVLGISMLAGLALALAPMLLRRMGMTPESVLVLMAVVEETDERVMVRQADDTTLAIRVGLRDTVTIDYWTQEAEARHLATVAAEALPADTRTRSVHLSYVLEAQLFARAIPRDARQFRWALAELRPGSTPRTP